MRRQLAIGLATGALVAVMLPGVTAARVDGGCPAGKGWDRFEAFDRSGTFRLDAYLEAYPNNQAAIDDDVYTKDDLVAGYEATDRNGNRYVCIKDVYFDLNGQRGQGFSYYVSAIDDNAAP